MGATLIQPCRVKDEGPMGRKLLLQGTNIQFVNWIDGTLRIRVG